MRRRQHARRDVDADLNGLTPGGAEIVPLEIGALDPLLRAQCVKREYACGDEYRRRHSRQHGSPLRLGWIATDVQRRSDPNAARSSALKSSGCSHAAKCPPLSTSWK